MGNSDFGTLIGHQKVRFFRHHGAGAGIGSYRSAPSLGATPRSVSSSGATGSGWSRASGSVTMTAPLGAVLESGGRLRFRQALVDLCDHDFVGAGLNARRACATSVWSS